MITNRYWNPHTLKNKGGLELGKQVVQQHWWSGSITPALHIAYQFLVKYKMHFKVMVFILKVLSGSDPAYWIPPLRVGRESTMTTVTFTNANVGATSNRDTTAGDVKPKRCRRHGNAHRTTVPRPAKANEEKLSPSVPKPEYQSTTPK